MRRISVHTLLGMSTEDLWGSLHGPFILVLDDGEIETNHREVIYSSYAWDLIREFPLERIEKQHHVADVLRGKPLGSNTHLNLLAQVVWSVHDQYVNEDLPHAPGWRPSTTLDHLARRVYEITNLMYNDLTYRLEEYVVSLDITHFIEILDHPGIIAARKPLYEKPLDRVTDDDLRDTYNAMTNVIKNDPSLDHSLLARASRAGTIKHDQLLQCVGPRGRVTDVDSVNFHLPILRSFTEGYRSIYDSGVESRSSAKSLLNAQAPLKGTEYFSRRLQLMSMNIQHLHRGDCGTTKYIPWKMTKKDLKRLAGKYYLDEEKNKLRVLKGDEAYLVNKLVPIRSVMNCNHPDPIGVCSTCFGALSHSVPEFTNIGHLCCMVLTEKSSQSVLSTKHLDSSASIEALVLNEMDRMYLKVGTDDNSYLMASQLKGVSVKVVFDAKDIPSISDVLAIDTVENLTISRFSSIHSMGIVVDQGKKIDRADVVTEWKGRVSSLTHEFLEHIRLNGYTTDEFDNYVIDLQNWDWNKPILALPLKHYNMAEHSREIAGMLESSVEEMQNRDKNLTPSVALSQLYDLVNQKLDVGMAILDIVLYEAMVISAEEGNYALPKGNSPTSGFGVMSQSMLHRSLSAAMAFEGHRDVIVNPVSYIQKNRLPHPFDAVLMPYESLSQPAVVYG
jgi:hypothetical protein